MECSNCFSMIIFPKQCKVCKGNLCSLSCLKLHYAMYHPNGLYQFAPQQIQPHKQIISPYLVKGYLHSEIIYDELYSLKNFVPAYDGSTLKIIGSGSYGQVYLALNVVNQKYYAIKHMDKKKLYAMLHSFNGIYKEIDIQSRIEHPNIVKLLYVNETKDNFDLVMDYAPSGSLFNYIRMNKGLSESKSFCLFIQIVNAINCLHENDLIHRDIKPENILLYDSNTVRLCDFGWCVKLNGQQRGTFCGTTEYMSPELVNHKEYSKEIDVWSLGVLLYEMIHSYSPFKPNKIKFDERDVMENIKHHRLTFGKQVSIECRDLIFHLLDPNINNRYTVEDIYNSSFVKKYEKANYCIPNNNINNNFYNSNSNQIINSVTPVNQYVNYNINFPKGSPETNNNNNLFLYFNDPSINDKRFVYNYYVNNANNIKIRNQSFDSSDKIIYNNNNNIITNDNNIIINDNNIISSDNNIIANDIISSDNNIIANEYDYLLNENLPKCYSNDIDKIAIVQNVQKIPISNENIGQNNNKNQNGLCAIVKKASKKFPERKKGINNNTADNFYPRNIEKKREKEIIDIYSAENNNMKNIPQETKRDNINFIDFSSTSKNLLNIENNKEYKDKYPYDNNKNNRKNNNNSMTNINKDNIIDFGLKEKVNYAQKLNESKKTDNDNKKNGNDNISNIIDISSCNKDPAPSPSSLESNVNLNYYYNFDNYNNNFTNNYYNNKYRPIAFVRKIKNPENPHIISIDTHLQSEKPLNKTTLHSSLLEPSIVSSSKTIYNNKSENAKIPIQNSKYIYPNNNLKISDFSLEDDKYNLNSNNDKEIIVESDNDSTLIQINNNNEAQKNNNSKYLKEYNELMKNTSPKDRTNKNKIQKKISAYKIKAITDVELLANDNDESAKRHNISHSNINHVNSKNNYIFCEGDEETKREENDNINFRESKYSKYNNTTKNTNSNEKEENSNTKNTHTNMPKDNYNSAKLLQSSPKDNRSKNKYKNRQNIQVQNINQKLTKSKSFSNIKNNINVPSQEKKEDEAERKLFHMAKVKKLGHKKEYYVALRKEKSNDDIRIKDKEKEVGPKNKQKTKSKDIIFRKGDLKKHNKTNDNILNWSFMGSLLDSQNESKDNDFINISNSKNQNKSKNDISYDGPKNNHNYPLKSERLIKNYNKNKVDLPISDDYKKAKNLSFIDYSNNSNNSNKEKIGKLSSYKKIKHYDNEKINNHYYNNNDVEIFKVTNSPDPVISYKYREGQNKNKNYIHNKVDNPQLKIDSNFNLNNYQKYQKINKTTDEYIVNHSKSKVKLDINDNINNSKINHNNSKKSYINNYPDQQLSGEILSENNKNENKKRLRQIGSTDNIHNSNNKKNIIFKKSNSKLCLANVICKSKNKLPVNISKIIKIKQNISKKKNSNSNICSKIPNGRNNKKNIDTESNIIDGDSEFYEINDDISITPKKNCIFIKINPMRLLGDFKQSQMNIGNITNENNNTNNNKSFH